MLAFANKSAVLFKRSLRTVWNHPIAFIPAFMLLSLASFGATRPFNAPIWLWEGKAPYTVGESSTDQPNITVFRAPADKANGSAVIICPGGGYGTLSTAYEGKPVAEFFNNLGVTAFVLKYRLANKNQSEALYPAPLVDAQRAIRFVRARAAEFGIDPTRVGICGFSAGGHLASTAGTHFDYGNKDAADPIERQSCRPDFMILAYPVITLEDGITHPGTKRNLLGSKPDEKLIENLSNDKQVTKDTPPTFLFHTKVDTAVVYENSVRFCNACKNAGVPVEMYLCDNGEHGVGLARDPKVNGGDQSLRTWTDHLAEWMKTKGY